MRIVFIGTVEFSKKTLEKLICLKADITGVVTKRASIYNSDFANLTKVCDKSGIPHIFVKDINSAENIKWIKALEPDIIFCFGFSQLLNKDLLNIAPMGVVGYHPARLPQHRGRHPIIWALALGLTKTASTFFFMKERADSGDVLSEAEVDISYLDTARTLYDKVTAVALKQIENILPQLSSGKFLRRPQDKMEAGYWRKRSKEDGKIDFRKDARSIYNLIRALTEPYVGAHLIYKGKEIKVNEAEESKITTQDAEPGEVLNVKAGRVLVKCGNGAIVLTKHDFHILPKKGESLL